MSAALTDEERDAILWAHYNHGMQHAGGVLDTVESIIDAHVRRALEDAADEVEVTGSAPGLRPTNLTYKNLGVHRWLRARAAAVAPRETKD